MCDLKKLLWVFIPMFMLCNVHIKAQEVATPMSQDGQDSVQTISTEHPSQMDLTFNLVICNKTKSTYRISLAGHFVGKVTAKKKQSFPIRADWYGEIVAIQLDHYSIVPSKITWKLPAQTPGNTVTFNITDK